MTFHQIDTPTDPKVIGVTNGTFQCELNEGKLQNTEEYQAISSFFDYSTWWSRKNHTPTRNFKFEFFQLLEKAKLTNILSYSPFFIGCQFIINSKAQKLLYGLKLNNCYFFPCTLYDYNEKLIEGKYYMLYINPSDYEFINFDKSVFYYGSEILGKRYIGVNNLTEFNTLLEENPLLNAETISIKKEHVNSDLINTRIAGLFASERLIDRWKGFGVTGIRTPERQKMIVE